MVKSFTVPAASKPVITLKDVAERAGLSLATVSYALRQHPKIPVETRERAAAAARELGYRPNPRVASLMAHGRSNGVRADRCSHGFPPFQIEEMPEIG